MAAEGDTSHTATRETVQYQGTEIQYDVDRGTVDVLGQGPTSSIAKCISRRTA
jgi:hypothetical protein